MNGTGGATLVWYEISSEGAPAQGTRVLLWNATRGFECGARTSGSVYSWDKGGSGTPTHWAEVIAPNGGNA